MNRFVNKSASVIAVLLFICVGLVFSSESLHAGHDCTGDGCPVCQLVLYLHNTFSASGTPVSVAFGIVPVPHALLQIIICSSVYM